MIRPTAVHLGSGSRIGSYDIVSPLGAGGMGEVYRARDSRLQRDVAIKVLPATFSAQPDRLARFEREARALAALNHPNIAQIYGLDTLDQAVQSSGEPLPFIVMELVEGTTLADRIRATGAMPVTEVVLIARQIADALDAAHEKGIVHRDLKPANIALRPDGTIKILDFGLATDPMSSAATQLTHSPTVLDPTASGVILGTAPYMSPEQARGAPVDKRTDIWAFGCVLYEMLTGVAAFGRATISDTLAAILERSPDWEALPSGVPATIRQLLDACLQKDVKRRLRDIGDARRDLEVPPHATGHVTPTRSGWRVAALIGSVALATAAFTWIAAIRLRPSSTDRDEPTLSKMTWDAGLSTEPALSPDGTLLVYASDVAGQGNLDLWLQRVSGGPPVQLTRDVFDDREPMFSPDGSTIAFRSERAGGGVFVMPALGGDARLVAPHGRRPRYSPDGREIAFWTGSWLGGTRTAGTAVFIVAANGGAPRGLSNGFVSARNPVWAPDGRSVLFFGAKGQGGANQPIPSTESVTAGQFDWWRAPVSGGEPSPVGVYPILMARHMVFSPPWNIESLPDAWTRDGVVFSGTVAQATNLWQIELSPTGNIAGAPHRLTSGAGADTSASIDDHGRIAFEVSQSTEGVFRLVLDANEGRSTGRIDRLAADWGYTAHRGSLTPDERFLAYPKHRSDESQLWLKDLSTGTERHLTTTAPVELNPTIAADGSAIAFTIRENGRFGGRIIAAAGGAVKNVCEDCLLHAWLDTRTIVGLFPSGHPRVRLLDVQTLTTADVFDIDEPINRLIPTSDRRWLAVGARDRTWIVPLQPGSVKTPATAQTIVYEPNDVIPGRLVGWSPDGRLLYSLLGFDGFRCLYAQHVDHGSLVGGPVIVHHFHDPHRLWGSTPLSNAITNRGFVFDQVETAASIWLRDRPQRE